MRLFLAAVTLVVWAIPASAQWLDRATPGIPRGAGAARFGFPSAVRGMPGVARSSLWADAGIAQTTRVTAARNNLI